MSALRFSRRHIMSFAALGGAAALLAAWQTTGDGFWQANVPDLASRLSDMRSSLPLTMENGATLDDIQLDGNRLTLRLAVDDRLDLAAVRDGDRGNKCDVWRSALRGREIASVEYRYVQTGATSSLFLDRNVCG